jgi:hypothetical protein
MDSARHRLVVLSNPMPGKRDEYEEWYEGHLEQVLTVPGIDAAQRFRLSDDQFPAGLIPPSDHQFLTIYEVSGDPAIVGDALLQPDMSEVPDVFDHASERAWWYTAAGEILGDPIEAPRTKLVVFSNSASEELDAELNDWYDAHLSGVIAIGAGVVSAQRFRASTYQFPPERMPSPTHRYLAIYDTDSSEAHTCNTLGDAMQKYDHPHALDVATLRDWMWTAASDRRHAMSAAQ